MKTYYTNDFRGHYAVGTAAVVMAKDEASARRKLRALFKKHGLTQDRPTDKWTVHELTPGRRAIMLNNGQY